MPYTKTTWKDRVVEKPMTYTLRDNGDGTHTLLSAEGTIIETGTPINALIMNNLENQYEQAVLESLPRTGGDLTGPITSDSDLTTTANVNATDGNFTGNVSANGITALDDIIANGGLTVANILKMTDGTNTRDVIITRIGDGTGIGIAIGGDGTTVIGGGESAKTVLADTTLIPVGANEYMWVTSDNDVYVFTNLQNGVATGKQFVFSKTGNLDAPNGFSVNGSPIVAKGSNGNGDWIQFYDGTMICKFTGSTTGTSIATAYGSLFQGARTWTFPSTFTVAPEVFCGQFKWGTGASWGMVNSATTTSALFNVLDVSSRATGTTVNLMHMAIGKWK